MGRQAEAERDRRAKIIAADGELQASVKLSQAAAAMSSPAAMQLRTLQTMAEISTERNSTIVFPIPVEIMHAVKAFTTAQEVLASQALGVPLTGISSAEPNPPTPLEPALSTDVEVPPLPDIPPPPVPPPPPAT